MSGRQDEQVFSLNHVLSPHVRRAFIGDPRIVEQIKQGLVRELRGSMERQGYEPVGTVDITITQGAFTVEPPPQSFWDWLLRRPREVPEPMDMLRVRARAVPKGTLS